MNAEAEEQETGVLDEEDGFGAEHRLATYGALAPGLPNEHQLDGLGDGADVVAQIYALAADEDLRAAPRD